MKPCLMFHLCMLACAYGLMPMAPRLQLRKAPHRWRMKAFMMDNLSTKEDNLADPQSARQAWRRDVRKEVVSFAGPALSTVLADPLMSCIDMVAVTRSCSTLQLASLGPPLAVFNFANYFFFFLNAATTVLVTRSLACDDVESATGVLSNAMALALACGLGLSAILITFAEPLITSTGCVAALIPTAVRYLRVRALAQPVLLPTMVLQSALLAQRDAVTPLQVIAASCGLNIIGDILLVPRLGAVGAAWATFAAQLISLPMMLAVSRMRKRLPARPRLPGATDLRRFLSTAAPLFVNEIGFSSCYYVIQSMSTQFTVAASAAFQALWSPLQVLCFATYPLKQAAQVFLPRIQADAETNGPATVGGEPKARELLKVLATLSTACGLFLAAFGGCLAIRPSFLTPDPLLWPMIASFAPLVPWPLLILGFAQVLEGYLLGAGDLNFLSASQIGNVLAACVAASFTRSRGMGIHGTWIVFLAFLASRATQAAIRVFLIRQPWKQDAAYCEPT